MDVLRDEELLEKALVLFGKELRARAPIAQAEAILRELEAECAPVLETLLGALTTGHASARHETLAMAALFGRRVATLRESPTLALAGIDAILHAVDGGVPNELESILRAAAMEGFASAVDERARAEMVERAGQSLVPVIVSPRVVLLLIAGCEDRGTLAQALARLGRTSLDADAKACLVHASFASEPERDVIAELAAFDGSAQMIGARAIYSGTPMTLHALQAHAPTLSFANTFEDALRLGLEAADHEVRPASFLARGLKRLRG